MQAMKDGSTYGRRFSVYGECPIVLRDQQENNVAVTTTEDLQMQDGRNNTAAELLMEP
jgi:hypothetical protein